MIVHNNEDRRRQLRRALTVVRRIVPLVARCVVLGSEMAGDEAFGKVAITVVVMLAVELAGQERVGAWRRY